MNDSVLTLGEKIVLAARLAAIEHVRRELAQTSAEPDATAGDHARTSDGLGKLPTIDSLVRGRWAAYFGHAEIANPALEREAA